jgi:hypothetical protein
MRQGRPARIARCDPAVWEYAGPAEARGLRARRVWRAVRAPASPGEPRLARAARAGLGAAAQAAASPAWPALIALPVRAREERAAALAVEAQDRTAWPVPAAWTVATQAAAPARSGRLAEAAEKQGPSRRRSGCAAPSHRSTLRGRADAPPAPGEDARASEVPIRAKAQAPGTLRRAGDSGSYRRSLRLGNWNESSCRRLPARGEGPVSHGPSLPAPLLVR